MAVGQPPPWAAALWAGLDTGQVHLGVGLEVRAIQQQL